MIDNLRTAVEWKIRLTMKMKFISTKHDGESQQMHFKSDNREIMIPVDTNEINE